MLSFQTTILTISLSDPHNDILTGTRVCYLSTRKGFIFIDGVKVPKTQGWDIKYV